MVGEPAPPTAQILIVEDEALVAEDLKRCVIRLGWGAVVVNSGEEALELVKMSQPDMALMDIRLEGGMDGLQTASLLRAQWNIPIVFITAYGSQEMIHRAEATEPYGYIVKPFREVQLQATLAVAFARAMVERGRVVQDQQADRVVGILETLGNLETMENSAIHQLDYHVADADPRVALLQKARMERVIQETIEQLEQTKHSFHSKALAQIRRKLERMLCEFR